MPFRTWQPKKLKRARTHGFRRRNRVSMSVLKSRRAKKRSQLAPQRYRK